LTEGDRTVGIAVLASGRGSNFQALAEGDTGSGRVELVVSDRPDAPVLRRAERAGVEAMHLNPGNYRTRMGIEEEREWARTLRSRGVGLVCLAGFMRMLKGPLLEEFAGAVMNIHPSLLPAFPGLEAQRQAVEYGVRWSGCTVHYVDLGMDSGPVILQEAVPVEQEDTAETLAERILRREHRIYPRAVSLHCAGRLRLEGRRVRILES
jgi:phosphoribosylglycinamide formyltransferase-1